MRVTPLLVLGLALATASPATARPEEDGTRVPFRGSGERYRRPSSERDWVRIASPSPTKHGTQYIIVDRNAGAFRSLRVDVDSGAVVLRRVAILTHDLVWKTFNVKRRLDARHPSLHIDLGSTTRISQIVVTTSRQVAGTYTIYASTGHTVPVLVAAK